MLLLNRFSFYNVFLLSFKYLKICFYEIFHSFQWIHVYFFTLKPIHKSHIISEFFVKIFLKLVNTSRQTPWPWEIIFERRVKTFFLFSFFLSFCSLSLFFLLFVFCLYFCLNWLLLYLYFCFILLISLSVLVYFSLYLCVT